jgi:hypothetical protein
MADGRWPMADGRRMREWKGKKEGGIFTAAIAQSTPPELLFSTTDFNSYVTVSTAVGAPQRVEGRMAASEAPGLGISCRSKLALNPQTSYGCFSVA